MSERDARAEFRSWLSGELENRDWSHAKLAREIGVFKGTVGRWLMDADHPMARTPSYQSCRKLADLFGVDFRSVLEMAGYDDFDYERDLSELQADVISVVQHLPDDLLATVYPQLKALLDRQTQTQVRQQLRELRERLALDDLAATRDPDAVATE